MQISLALIWTLTTALASTEHKDLEHWIHALFPATTLSGVSPEGTTCTLKAEYVPYDGKFAETLARLEIVTAGSTPTFFYLNAASRTRAVAPNPHAPLVVEAKNQFHYATSDWLWSKGTLAVRERDADHWLVDLHHEQPGDPTGFEGSAPRDSRSQCVISKAIPSVALPIQGLQALWIADESGGERHWLSPPVSIPCQIRELAIARSAEKFRLMGIHFGCANEADVITSRELLIDGSQLRDPVYGHPVVGTISEHEFTIDQPLPILSTDQISSSELEHLLIHGVEKAGNLSLTYSREVWNKNGGAQPGPLYPAAPADWETRLHGRRFHALPIP